MSAIAGLLTVTVTDAVDVWLTPSNVPLTVSVNVVGVTIGDRCTVRVEPALPPEVGVTRVGLKLTDTPAGAPEALSATVELKPLTELTVTEVEAVPPTGTVTGLIRPIEKSTTATWNVPVLEFPAGSVAVQVTVVAPAGTVEPEGGLQLMVRVEVALSGSVAPTAYVTTAPLALVATAVMSAGRLRVGAVVSSTTTVAVAVPVLPAASVAEQVMVVVPSGKVLPEAGAHVGVSEPDTASVAVAAYAIAAPLGPVASTGLMAGTVTTGAVVSWTSTVAMAEPTLPAVSVAVQAMAVLPSAKVLPEEGEQLGVSEPDTVSAAVAVKLTKAPLGPVASTTLGAVMVTTGDLVSVTVTVKLAFAALPCVSVAVQATVVRPRGKVLPDAGAQETVAASSGSVALTP